MTDFVSCYVEGKLYPSDACHRHHLDPQYTGGSDAAENLVWLSANAHNLIHRVAQLSMTGRTGQALDLAMKAYPSPAIRHRFMSVVKSEVDAASASKEAGTGKSEITMEIPIPIAEYSRLKLLVSDKRINGKKVSLKDYVQRLIISHVYKQTSR